MAESSFFFTSSGGDRLYTSVDFATVFNEIQRRGAGVFKTADNGLAVTNPGALSVDINTGVAAKSGYLYKNDASLNKALDAVTSGSKRYDRIVVRVDLTARTMAATVIKGVEGASPAVPAIDGSTDVLLAKILIDRSSGSYVYTVTDERTYAGAVIRADYRGNNGLTIGAGATRIDFSQKVSDPDSCVTTGASWAFTAPKAGLYAVKGAIFIASRAWTTGYAMVLSLIPSTYNKLYLALPIVQANHTDFGRFPFSADVYLEAGESFYLSATRGAQGSDLVVSDVAISGSAVNYNFIQISRIGD